MKYSIHLMIFVCLGIFLVACDPKEKEYSKIPEINLISLSNDTIYYTDSGAKIDIIIYFTDGDGDIAFNNEGTDSTIYIVDLRDGAFFRQFVFPMPYIPSENRQKNGALKGRVNITLQSHFFIPRLVDTAYLMRDSLEYEIYIKDYGGNTSNKIIVGPIFMES